MSHLLFSHFNIILLEQTGATFVGFIPHKNMQVSSPKRVEAKAGIFNVKAASEVVAAWPEILEILDVRIIDRN